PLRVWEACSARAEKTGVTRTRSADCSAPTLGGDDGLRRSWARFERYAVSPAGIKALLCMLHESDARQTLSVSRVPTLVVHRQGDQVTRVEGARYIAERIQGAKYVELPGNDHFPWVGDTASVLNEVEEFVTGARHGPDFDRVLATVLFTDIAGATAKDANL